MNNNSENEHYDYDKPPSLWITFLGILTIILFAIIVNYLAIMIDAYQQ